MAPSGEKADLAVPGEAREGSFCARCFAQVEAGETHCPDCGAPLEEGAPAADSAVHGELAKANLLRLRGDLAGSEKALLAILRRYPNDPYAHEMLGDVCADNEENERAVEWYELALDLSPNSAELRRKLDATRERIASRDAADTADVLGLPPANPPAAWWPLAAAAVLLLVAILVAAWPRSAAPEARRETIVAPERAQTVASNSNATPDAPADPAAPTPAPVGTEADRSLMADLQKRVEPVKIQHVVLDPRNGNVVVDFEVSEADDPREVATNLGKEALAAAPAASLVTLRALRAGQPVFAADLPRTALGAADPLTNVWPVPTDPASSAVGENLPPPAPSSGAAPPTGGPAPATPNGLAGHG